MPFLTINGQDIPVQSSDAVRAEDHRQGQVRYGFNGHLLVSLKSPKKEWRFTTRPLLSAEETTLRNAIGVDYLARSVDGTGINGPIQCLVLIGDQPYIQDGISHQQILEIIILET